MDRLSTEALASLRDAVERIADNGSGRMPLSQLVADHAQLTNLGEVTVDFGDQPGKRPIVILKPAEGQDACFDSLTEREKSVAELVAHGCTNRQIADKLFLSTSTVKDHIHNILGKSGLTNRASIAARFVL